jgi:hypothetical protein
MYIIVISFIVSLLFLLPTLYQVLSVNKPVKAKENLTELDFLYQYREILQKIMLIENELKAMGHHNGLLSYTKVHAVQPN